MRFVSAIAVSVSLSFVACGPAADVDTADRSVAPGEGALDEDSILEFLNGPDATIAVLTDAVRIQSRAARNIVAHVRGADDRLGSSDDDLLDDIAELDAILYVGPATIEAIEAYVRSHYQANDLTIEDVVLSSENATAMVALANAATARLLDDDVGLDSRAANAIVAARPISDVQALARVSYVGTTALVKLRDYVITHPTSPTTPVTPPAAGPRILSLAASEGYASDPWWEEYNDGVFVSYQTEGATRCQLELVSQTGAVIDTRGPEGGLDGAGAVATQAHAYFFGGSHPQEPTFDVRLTCTNASGASVARMTRAGPGVHIVNLSARAGVGTDPAWNESGVDGVHIEFRTERAVRCGLEVLSSADSTVLVSRGGDPAVDGDGAVETQGPYFIGKTTSAWDAGIVVTLRCVDVVGAVHANTTAVLPALPTVADVDCTSLAGGTFDGVTFTAAQECQGVRFLDLARFSEMSALNDSTRHIAYDCAPSGACGFRTSQWTNLAQFAGTTGVGAVTMTAVKASAGAWTQNGLPWDTVDAVWPARAALVDAPIHFDNVFVTRRLPDQNNDAYMYSCVELKDPVSTSGTTMSACIRYVDSAGDCSGAPEACLDDVVGTTVSLRGRFRENALAPGGYRLSITPDGPGPANPNAQ